MMYDGSRSADFVVLQIQIFDAFAGSQSSAEAFSTGSSEIVALKIETDDVGTAFDILGKDLNADI